jgi:hypothetical protein
MSKKHLQETQSNSIHQSSRAESLTNCRFFQFVKQRETGGFFELQLGTAGSLNSNWENLDFKTLKKMQFFNFKIIS